LDLDQRRNRILVEKQVVQRPPVASFFHGRDAHLPRDQEPPSGCGPIHLIAGQQVWVFGEKLLEHVLGVIGLLRHLHEIATTLNQEYAAVHRTPQPVVAAMFSHQICSSHRAGDVLQVLSHGLGVVEVSGLHNDESAGQRGLNGATQGHPVYHPRSITRYSGTCLSNPASASISKWTASRAANLSLRIKASTSMFRVWAASVKFADVTNAVRRSTTMRFACKLDRLTASRSSERGS